MAVVHGAMQTAEELRLDGDPLSLLPLVASIGWVFVVAWLYWTLRKGERWVRTFTTWGALAFAAVSLPDVIGWEMRLGYVLATVSVLEALGYAGAAWLLHRPGVTEWFVEEE